MKFIKIYYLFLKFLFGQPEYHLLNNYVQDNKIYITLVINKHSLNNIFNILEHILCDTWKFNYENKIICECNLENRILYDNIVYYYDRVILFKKSEFESLERLFFTIIQAIPFFNEYSLNNNIIYLNIIIYRNEI